MTSENNKIEAQSAVEPSKMVIKLSIKRVSSTWGVVWIAFWVLETFPANDNWPCVLFDKKASLDCGLTNNDEEGNRWEVLIEEACVEKEEDDPTAWGEGVTVSVCFIFKSTFWAEECSGAGKACSGTIILGGANEIVSSDEEEWGGGTGCRNVSKEAEWVVGEEKRGNFGKSRPTGGGTTTGGGVGERASSKLLWTSEVDNGGWWKSKRELDGESIIANDSVKLPKLELTILVESEKKS